MKLEELIQKRFVSTAALAERLATYNGVPAVFSPEAPGDEQEGWGGETQYPRQYGDRWVLRSRQQALCGIQ